MTTYYGGPDAITAGGFASCAAQAFTFPAAATLTTVRSSWNAYSGGRVGFCASKPSGPNAVTWLAYADVAAPPTATWVESTLSAPVSVAAGQTIWAVAIGSAIGQYIDANKGAMVGGVTVSGDPFYASDPTSSAWTGQTAAGWRLNVQGGAGVVPPTPSGQLWPRRTPPAPGVSGQLWPRG